MKFKATPPKGAGNLVKLTSGASITGVFRGEPVEFWNHWIAKRGIRCSGPGCQHCAAGDSPRFRFQLNFVTQENGALVAKVFEGAGEVYEMLKALNGESVLEWLKVKVIRQGSGQNDTKYFVMPLPDQSWDPEARRQLEALKLQDLGVATATAPDETALLAAAGAAGTPVTTPAATQNQKSFF